MVVLYSYMVKNILILCIFSIALVGCSKYSNSQSLEKTASIKEFEQKNSLNVGEKVLLNDFSKINFIPIDLTNNSEYSIPNFNLENAEVVMLGPIDLKKSDKISLEFKLKSNDSFNHMSIGIIKDFNPDFKSNQNLEMIYSESIDDELKVTYTAPVDSNYAISILGTMADTILVKNGKIIKH